MGVTKDFVFTNDEIEYINREIKTNVESFIGDFNDVVVQSGVIDKAFISFIKFKRKQELCSADGVCYTPNYVTFQILKKNINKFDYWVDIDVSMGKTCQIPNLPQSTCDIDVKLTDVDFYGAFKKIGMRLKNSKPMNSYKIHD